MSTEERPLQGVRTVAQQFRREVFGPGLPEHEARFRLLATVFTTATVVVWGAVLVVCGWALTTLAWRACVPLCLATLAIGFFVAFRLGNRALRKQFPEDHNEQDEAKTQDGKGTKQLTP